MMLFRKAGAEAAVASSSIAFRDGLEGKLDDKLDDKLGLGPEKKRETRAVSISKHRGKTACPESLQGRNSANWPDWLERLRSYVVGRKGLSNSRHQGTWMRHVHFENCFGPC
jgi:hypothetical protein